MTKNKHIENLEEQIEELCKRMNRETTRINRIVQVLLKNLPDKNLDKEVYFCGIDCCGTYDYGNRTLRSFLRHIVDP